MSDYYNVALSNSTDIINLNVLVRTMLLWHQPELQYFAVTSVQSTPPRTMISARSFQEAYNVPIVNHSINFLQLKEEGSISAGTIHLRLFSN